MSRKTSRGAAAESRVQSRSAPPLDQLQKIILRSEAARRYNQVLSPCLQYLCTPSGCDTFDSRTRGGALTRWYLATLFRACGVFVAWALTLLPMSTLLGQTRSYPKEIRGYKVERTVVELKKPDTKKVQPTNGGAENSDSNADQLISFGQPALARVTPLGITFEVPIVVAPVKQSGHIEFLVFEDMEINGRSVEIDEYHRDFDLPSKQSLTLREPLSIYIYLPSAVLAALGEWTDSKETWPVTGRVYVFGKFRKSVFSFKRCVPVELNLMMRNPLKEQ